jgi:hypothetical protein
MANTTFEFACTELAKGRAPIRAARMMASSRRPAPRIASPGFADLRARARRRAAAGPSAAGAFLLREADRTFLKPGKHGSEPSAKAMDEGWRCELRRRCEISEAVPSASIANDVVRPLPRTGLSDAGRGGALHSPKPIEAIILTDVPGAGVPQLRHFLRHGSGTCSEGPWPPASELIDGDGTRLYVEECLTKEQQLPAGGALRSGNIVWKNQGPALSVIARCGVGLKNRWCRHLEARGS